MRYLKLSSDSSKFSISIRNSITHLSWFTTLDLSNVKTVGLTNIQISPLTENVSSDYYLVIYSNLIKPTECNPNGELACVRVPKKHNTIPSQVNLGKLVLDITNRVSHTLEFSRFFKVHSLNYVYYSFMNHQAFLLHYSSNESRSRIFQIFQRSFFELNLSLKL